MTKRKIDPSEYNRIIGLYRDDRRSARSIGEQYGVSNATILDVLRRSDVTIRGNGEAHKSLAPDRESEVVARYKAGREGCGDIAKDYGISKSTVRSILLRHDVEIRPTAEVIRRLTKGKEDDVARLYTRERKNIYQIAKMHGISHGTVIYTLNRLGIPRRNKGESQRALSPDQIKEVCRLYEKALYTTVDLAGIYGVSSTCIAGCLRRSGVVIRTSYRCSDRPRDAIKGTGRFRSKRRCGFYVYQLANTGDFIKCGISSQIDKREYRSGGHYGEQLLLIEYASRREAFFLEQAVLAATKASANCPQALWDERWIGCSEVRQMPADELLSIAQQLADELEELGEWEFAVRYVPMTEAERLICRERADLPAAA